MDMMDVDDSSSNLRGGISIERKPPTSRPFAAGDSNNSSSNLRRAPLAMDSDEEDLNTCPYKVGRTVTFKVDGGRQVTAKIVGLFEPFTVCSLMLVELNDEKFKGQFVLKLYDRRFAATMRHYEYAQPWGQEIEQEYREFVDGGCVRDFLDMVYCECRDDMFFLMDNWHEWSRAKQEAYLWHILNESYNQEKKSYAMMEDIQGVHIPRIFARVSLQTDPEDQPDEFLEVRGFLMEHIKGFTLEYIKEAPRKDWQGICDEAISIVHKVSDYGICNRQVRPQSFVVRYEDGNYKVFMLDFGMVRFRMNALEPGKWTHWQADEDEEGSIANPMKRMLGDGFEYRPSKKKLELDAVKGRVWM